MHAFRDNKASLLIATPAAARGLDLPAVSFVYNTSAPSDATDYLHRAGRAGRIGSGVSGTASCCSNTELQIACVPGVPVMHKLVDHEKP
jgi:superfamily II DNA/RNA helicase